ncbi:MAG: ubiquinone/menaquinone biosynthesis C-methylase UbiE [Candidatus Omnitrophota bacterium]|jgi:ubiquinone/menaquinone biosynthesis C-methylase UbiE
MNAETIAEIERKTIELYTDIHPYVDIEYTIDYYLKTIKLDPSFFKGKDILDCGFGGTGWASELFARSGARSVSGIDINPQWPERILKRLSKYPAKLDFKQGSVLDLPFEENTFDYVHSHGVMHHTVDWKKGVSEMVRVLKPGGTMYLGVYGTFGPIGTAIYAILRGMAKIIPYKFAAAFVKKTGFLRHSEYSILDLMYVPVEEHLKEEEVLKLLNGLGIQKIEIGVNYKWQKGALTHPLLFGKKIHHAFIAQKSSADPKAT